MPYGHPNYHKQFTEVLARVDAHPNRRYFAPKSIILNNLYAVDIMEEAVEICKLRLFLKLAAQVEPDIQGVEPELDGHDRRRVHEVRQFARQILHELEGDVHPAPLGIEPSL